MAGELTGDTIHEIRERLLGWYRENARDLPWRSTRDPYAILVSEIMLQQTQVDRVKPYYEAFLQRFPSVRSLAEAPTAEVIRLWSGLGYNRRAVNLQRAAQAIVGEFGGEFPRDIESLRLLPGVGDYTAGAIAAFAFEQDVTFLDTNMKRVVSRVIFGEEQVPRRPLFEAAHRLAPPHAGWEWNQALIEFGALHCTSRRPACVICPLQRRCASFGTIQARLAADRGARQLSSTEPYTATNRFYRGRIVETLRALPDGDSDGIELDRLGPLVRDGYDDEHRPWLLSLVEDLQRDGLAVVAEDAPPYDAAGPPRRREARIRLP